MTPERAKEKMAKKFNDIAKDFDTEVRQSAPDDVIVANLKILNEQSQSWTNEDPNLEAIKACIKAHPPTDDNGNPIHDPVPIDGAVTVKAKPVTIAAFNVLNAPREKPVDNKLSPDMLEDFHAQLLGEVDKLFKAFVATA